MSAADDRIEKLRAGFEAINRGERDVPAEMAHPDIEVVRVGQLPPITGVAAFREWLEPDAFEETAYDDLEFTASGDKVLSHQRIRARGAGSGIEMELETWAVWTFDDDDLVVRAELYLEHDEPKARAAAGLPPAD
jgi:ketosteroid isomerase-like protein